MLDAFGTVALLNQHYDLASNFPTNRFVLLNQQPFFPKGSSLFVLFLHKTLLAAGTLDVHGHARSKVNLPIGKMDTITCASLPVGYLFQFPRMHINILPNSMKVLKPEALAIEKFTGARKVLSNNHLAVFTSNDDVALVVITDEVTIVDIKRS